MPRVCSLELSCAVAETALAKLWLCLEEHAIATPELRLGFPAGDRVRLTVISNASPQAVSLLRAWAAEWRNSRAGHQKSATYNIKRLQAQLRSAPDAAAPSRENLEHPVSAAISARKLGAL